MAGRAARADGPWIVGDIGGTNARFGCVDPAQPGVIQHLWTTPTAAHPGPADAIAAYLEGQRLPRPAAVGLAVATAVVGDEARLTNSHWHFRRADLAAATGASQVVLLNDFEALALSLPTLQPRQLRAHAALPVVAGTLAVVGPGTGLGVGSVVQTPVGWQALPGEGGHATLAPADDFESEVIAWVRRTHAHVSAERLLSGIGLPLLHAAVGAVRGRGALEATAPDIVQGAIAPTPDDDARATVEAFCAMLGGFCGSTVLITGARSGLFVGGGIVPRLGDAFFASPFRERFEAKGRCRAYLEPVPTAVITDTLAALGGAVAALGALSPPPVPARPSRG